MEMGVVVSYLGSNWLEVWKSGRIENGGRMEKWEDRKDFNFPYFCLVKNEKSRRMKKVSLYKFTHVPLLKNDAQLKPKK